MRILVCLQTLLTWELTHVSPSLLAAGGLVLLALVSGLLWCSNSRGGVLLLAGKGPVLRLSLLCRLQAAAL